MTHASNSALTYLQMQISTSSPSKLICILHEQCAILLRQSQESAAQKRRPLLYKTQNILALLQRSLRMTDSTSKSLFYLYDYCYVLLEAATPSHISDALTVIDILRDTFNQLQTH